MNGGGKALFSKSRMFAKSKAEYYIYKRTANNVFGQTNDNFGKNDKRIEE